MRRLSTHNGFTLLEFSVVLIIIGLVIGGVATGQHFIHAAELRSITTEANLYISSTRAFMDKFEAIPGDMDNAIDYWGAQDAAPATCATTASPTALTCNGNGNKTVGERLLEYDAHSSAMRNAEAEAYEKFRFWQHLKNAELITGLYTGVAGPSGDNHTIIATNVPRSEYTSGGFSVHFLGDWPGDKNFWDGRYGHIFMFGGQAESKATTAQIITAKEAEQIDTKIDDGIPSNGNVLALKYGTEFLGNCATNTNVKTAVLYDSATASSYCSLIFKGGF